MKIINKSKKNALYAKILWFKQECCLVIIVFISTVSCNWLKVEAKTVLYVDQNLTLVIIIIIVVETTIIMKGDLLETYSILISVDGSNWE